MLDDRVTRTAFLISLAGHCLFLGSSGFNFPMHKHEKHPEELTVHVEIEKPALLPKIDIMGQEKKLKEVKQEPEQPKPEPQPQSLLEEITIQETPKKRVEEKLDVVNPDKDAMLRYQDMVKQRIEATRRYPLWAKKQGVEGIAHIYFTVLPEGAGQDIRIIRSSGSIILDEESVATVKRASPFPPIPKEISSSTVGMEVAIVFSLNKD